MSIRPDEYDEHRDPMKTHHQQHDTASSSSNQQPAQQAEDLSCGLPILNIHDILSFIDTTAPPTLPSLADPQDGTGPPNDDGDAITIHAKTPLLLDTNPAQPIMKFFGYRGEVVDLTPLSVPYAKSGVKMADVQEMMRAKMVNAMKRGTICCLYFGQMTGAQVDVKRKLLKPVSTPVITSTAAATGGGALEVQSCPLECMMEGGRALLRPFSNPRYQKMFKPEEKEHGICCVRDGFRVIVVLQCEPREFVERWKESLPLGYMQAAWVRS